jgi:photosystem II stability/assembly factor-like uncharacterized protein
MRVPYFSVTRATSCLAIASALLSGWALPALAGRAPRGGAPNASEPVTQMSSNIAGRYQTLSPMRHKAPHAATETSLPIEWRGTWQASTLSGLTYVDDLGQYAPPTGSIVQLKFTSRGAFTWEGLLQAEQPGCAHRVLVYETGTASLRGSRLTLTPGVNTVTNEDTCSGGTTGSQPRPLSKQIYVWKLDEYQRGSKLCLELLSRPSVAPDCYWLLDSPIPAVVKADASWAVTYQDPRNVDASLSGVSCPNVSFCMAVGNDGILISTSGGKTWAIRVTKSELSTFGPNGVSCVSVNYCVIVGNGGISFSPNGGSKWETAPLQDTVLDAVSCPGFNTCVAVGMDGGIWRLSSKGWAPVSTPAMSSLDTLRSVSCANRRTCTAVGDDGLVITTSDGGITWALRTGEHAAGAVLGAVSCRAPGTCVGVGLGQETTKDGGVTWADHAPGIDDVFDGEQLHAISCATTSECTSVGESGTILSSSNGGQNWRPQLALGGTPFASLNAVSCPRSDMCVAVGQGGKGGVLIIRSSR